LAELVYNDEKHEYTMGGELFPSVTQVISPLIDFSMIPPHVLEKAAAFGKNVHKAIELYLLDELDPNIDPALVPPLEAFKRWQDKEGAEFFLTEWPRIETPMAHKRLKYAGMPDLDFLYGPTIDIKTRKYNKLTDPIQLEGYGELSRANGGANGDKIVLELTPIGEYFFTPANDKKAKGRWRLLLEHFYNEKNIQSWKNDK
jgi:hypothetical protein